MKPRYLKTTDQSIQGQLSKVKPEQALAEYIWNGFDANATKIELNTEMNELNKLISITVRDNGDGIDYDELENTLDLFLDSKRKTFQNLQLEVKKVEVDSLLLNSVNKLFGKLFQEIKALVLLLIQAILINMNLRTSLRIALNQKVQK